MPEITIPTSADASYRFGRVKSFDDENYTMDVVANSGQVDRWNEILVAEGCDWENFMKNPVFLWGHDDWSFPVGKVTKIWVDENEGLMETVQFAVKEDPVRAATCWKLFRGEYLNAVSVRFWPQETISYEDDSAEFKETGCRRKYTEWELLETSAVNIPCDPLALRKALTVLHGQDPKAYGNFDRLDMDQVAAKVTGLLIDSFKMEPGGTAKSLMLAPGTETDGGGTEGEGTEDLGENTGELDNAIDLAIAKAFTIALEA